MSEISMPIHSLEIALYVAEKLHVGVIPRIAGAFPGFRLDAPRKTLIPGSGSPP